MITLTNEHLENPNFGEALKKLYHQDDLPITSAFALNKLYKEIESNNLSFVEVKNKIQKKWSVEENDKVIIPKENVPSYTTEMVELLGVEFSINADPIPYTDTMKLSASDIELLNNIIDFTSIGE